MRNLIATLSLLCSTVVFAQQVEDKVSSEPPKGPLLIDVRAGAAIPSLFNKLKPTYVLSLEGAYQFAFDQLLGAYVEGSYTAPTATGTRTDSRVTANGGEETWSLSVRDFGISVGPRVATQLSDSISLYGAIGPRLHLTRSIVTATAGDVNLGTNTEYSSRFGLALRAGLGISAGPGVLLVELAGEHLPVDHLITGDANTSQLSLQLGYGFRL